MNISEIIDKIKQKKELQDLDNNFVKNKLNEYLKKNNITNVKDLKDKEVKIIVKDLRKDLRKSYGLFRDKIDFKKIEISDDETNILKFHSSTKERLSIYLQLYKQIFKITNKPEVILDLGCGLNPFSWRYMKLDDSKKINYHAYDLSEEEIKLINKYFNKVAKTNKHFNGKAELLNLENLQKVKQLPKADLAFLFKVTDVIDKNKGHKKSEELIKAIPSKFIVVSFPTKTMSGKLMNYPRRGWIELMCERLEYKFEFLEFSNEMFYVIKK